VFARKNDQPKATMSDRDAEVRRAETEAAMMEKELAEQLRGLREGHAEAGAKLQALKAASAQAQLAGARDPRLEALIARLAKEKLPALEVAAQREKALAARAEAVQARLKINEKLRAQVQEFAYELSTRAAQLSQDAEVVAAIEQQMREAAVAAALRPEPPPIELKPKAVAPEPKPAAPRRVYPRVSLQAAIDLHSDTNFFSGFSTDLSVGGLFVATVAHAPIGSEIDLSFTLPTGEKIAAKGVVRWTREVNDKTPHVFPGLGVQFVGLEGQALNVIERFIAEREPMFYPD
jgi:uncharacterized protein (TIGR02266 family)